MKQVINLRTLLASLVSLLVSVNVNAHDAEIDGIYYNLVSKDKIATVTYQGENYLSAAYSGEVNIPSTIVYGGVTYDVTSIGNNAFRGCTALTSLLLPLSLTSIGEHAIRDCSNLVSASIPSSVTSIGEWAFYGCSRLLWASIPSSVTKIESFTFAYCSNLTSIDIPSSVTSIGTAAFMSCTGLNSVVIPSSVTSYISGSAFRYCSSLTSVTIEGSPNIDTNVFSDCSNLTTITLNGGRVNSKAFANCPELLDVFCKSENPPSVMNSDAFEGSYIENVTLHVPAACIGKYAADEFWGNSFRKIVTIESIEHPSSIALTDQETFGGYPVNVDMEKITYSRIYKNTNWQAWYVPFDVTLTSDVLSQFSFAKFAGTYTEDDGTFFISVARMREGDVVKANTPYLVQAKTAGTEAQVLTLTDATLYAAQEKGFSMNSAEKTVTIQGIYNTKTATDEDHEWYAFGGGKYIKASVGQTLSPYRFYMTITEREDNPYASTPNPTEVKIKVLGEDADGIDLTPVLSQGEGETNVYDLSGRRIEKEKATKGIYIINGKKVFVR